MISLGRTSDETNPAAASFGPSGTRALRDLLEKEGYSTSINTSATPLIGASDVAIAFHVNEKSTFEDITETDLQADPGSQILADQLDHGGKALVFDLDADFRTASQTAEETVDEAYNSVGPTSLPLKVNMADKSLVYPEADHVTVASSARGETIASAGFSHKGTLVEVPDGIIVTNRFIDKNDNALEAMRLIRMVAPAGSHLVFAEASFGHISEPGVLELIGPWALAAWWQLIALFLVIVYTLGKPFGYPDEERFVQRGARELVDAVALTYRRSGATHVALQRFYSYTDREIRRKLKLPSDASEADRNRLISPELASALHKVNACSFFRIKPNDALALATELEDKTREFTGQSVITRRRTRSTGV
jgi:hypothetical protein